MSDRDSVHIATAELEEAQRVADQIEAAFDSHLHFYAEIVAKRIRNLSVYRAQELKRALRDFNIHTMRWKDGS